jgi:hypothetical protein
LYKPQNPIDRLRTIQIRKPYPLPTNIGQVLTSGLIFGPASPNNVPSIEFDNQFSSPLLNILLSLSRSPEGSDVVSDINLFVPGDGRLSESSLNRPKALMSFPTMPIPLPIGRPMSSLDRPKALVSFPTIQMTCPRCNHELSQSPEGSGVVSDPGPFNPWPSKGLTLPNK